MSGCRCSCSRGGSRGYEAAPGECERRSNTVAHPDVAAFEFERHPAVNYYALGHFVLLVLGRVHQPPFNLKYSERLLSAQRTRSED